MARIVFEDSEFTSLVPPYRPGGSRLWEVGLIVRDDLSPGMTTTGGRTWEEKSYRWLVSDVDLSDADPKSLEIGRFHQRHPMFSGRAGSPAGCIPEEDVARNIAKILTPGCTLIGAAPQGDVDHLRDLLYRHRLPWVAHHHVIDIESWAVGWLNGQASTSDWRAEGRQLPGLPWKYRDVLAALGIVQDDDQQHTALGDAQIVRQVWDLTTGGA